MDEEFMGKYKTRFCITSENTRVRVFTLPLVCHTTLVTGHAPAVGNTLGSLQRDTGGEFSFQEQR